MPDVVAPRATARTAAARSSSGAGRPRQPGAVLAGRRATAVPPAAAPVHANPSIADARPVALPIAAVAAAQPMVPREFGGGPTIDRLWQAAAQLPPGGTLLGVSSADGGVGRSTLVAALGGVLASATAGLVLAVDATCRSWGGLTERVHDGDRTVWDAVVALAAANGQPHPASHADADTVLGCTRSSPTGLRALVAEPSRTAARRPPVLRETTTAVERLRPLFAATLLDLPVADVRPAWEYLAGVNVPILVARAGVDSIRHTQHLLTQLRAAGLDRIADRTVVAVVATAPSPPSDARALCRQTAGRVGALVQVPYDPHLARAEPIDLRRTRRATRRALLELAAACLARRPTTTGAAMEAATTANQAAPPESQRRPS
ncbi:hypothetical protein [Dactylosporangium darangshiense]|uniref:hypothetical protein n=1 Tax=Dactylosporangium darangshiense TaxID=579108 RepID=UPI0031E7F62B